MGSDFIAIIEFFSDRAGAHGRISKRYLVAAEARVHAFKEYYLAVYA
ncbi:MAG: hypothetical protein O8C66_13915 [Candidatus Methanoperedens sp.]|nr:hypothetical protein [Candidatus Methanoperedens sp.]MCZ7371595.1 hypothetical protein [Candidatus Methanoperedens sp.]